MARIFLLKRLCLFAAATLLFVETLNYFNAANSPHDPRPGQTPSVLTFAYDSLRSGVALSTIDFTKPLSAHPLNLPFVREAKSWMPLYINGHKEGKKYFPDRRVLIFSEEKKLTALDLDSHERLWSINLKRKVMSAPVIDLERGFVFTLTMNFDSIAFSHTLHQISLDGSKRRDVPIEFFETIPKEIRNRYPKTIPRTHCRSALGINHVTQPKTVFWGCSIQTSPEMALHYADNKAVHGYVISVPINSDGWISPDGIKSFRTSEVHDDPVTGFDTGVYNAGSGPSVLPDGSILVATGNGPTFLNKNNFGCSIVRIDGSTMQPLRSPEGKPYAFSANPEGYNECWYHNIEYTSSAVSTVQAHGRLISNVFRKDGYLTTFNPDRVGEPNYVGTMVQLGNEGNYGQPATFKKNEDEIFTFVASHSYVSGDPIIFYTTAEHLSTLDEITSAKCIGFLSKTEVTPGSKVQLLYSGPTRDRYMNALAESPLAKEVTSFYTPYFGAPGTDYLRKDFWAPYVEIAQIGYGFPSNYSSEFTAKFPLTELDFHRTSENTRLADLKGRKTFYLANPSKDCAPPNPSLIPIYEVKRTALKGLPYGLYAHSFQIQKDETLKKRWFYQNSALTPHRAHNALAMNLEKNVGVLAVGVENIRNGKSLLLLLNADSGIPQEKIPFNGKTYFNMPLFIDDLIILGTRDDGLAIYRLKPSSGFDFVLRNSLTYKTVYRTWIYLRNQAPWKLRK